MRKVGNRSRKKSTIKQSRSKCKKQGLVYDIKTKKCRPRSPNRKSRAKKSRAKKSRAKKSRGKKSRGKKSRAKKSRGKLLKELREECKKQGRVYDPKTKKCLPPKKITCDFISWVK